ncbi:PAS domain-containing sensor histidine kinase [Flavisolibacter nicotianae]|uniref:PAS domain-containing sensor histidine kinase n=1 Tax=Flavisolibacter nicotianae TaxID=2364882 RepID=UPI000EAFC1E6|nr:PAS domain S-box protein [Flavisolibacter nicotianae]
MEDLFTLFEMTPDLVCIVSKEGYFKKINPAVSRKLHYTEAELMARPVSDFIHPDDKALTAKARAGLLESQPLLNFQNRYLTRNGNTVWLEWTSIYLPDAETVFAIAKDITPRKLSELELSENVRNLRQLTTQIKHQSEKERQQLAGELHEDLGQLATSIKMKIEWLSEQQHGLSPQLERLLDQTLASANLLVNKIRKVSYALSPANISLLGLNASLQLLCADYATHTGIACRYKSRFREENFSDEVKVDLYRVCQEALQNAWQQAAASEVTVFLRQTSRGLSLTVTDNGTGLNATAKKSSCIDVMKARALSINGKLTIKTGADGTTIGLLLAHHCAVAG